MRKYFITLSPTVSEINSTKFKVHEIQNFSAACISNQFPILTIFAENWSIPYSFHKAIFNFCQKIQDGKQICKIKKKISYAINTIWVQKICLKYVECMHLLKRACTYRMYFIIPFPSSLSAGDNWNYEMVFSPNYLT